MDSNRDLTWNEAHHALVPLMRPNNRTNLYYILKEYVLIAGFLAACAFAYHSWAAGRLPLWGFLPLAGLGMVALAAMQHRLSALAHDASHYALFHNKLANELVSDIFLMFPIMGMTQRFRVTHLAHHQYLNDPIKDPDIVRLNQPEPHRFPISKAGFVRRYVLRALWPLAIWPYLFGQAKGANSTEGGVNPNLKSLYRFRLGRSMRGAFWLSTLTVVHLTGNWPIFFLFWVAPLLTFYPLIMQIREIAHHSNAPDSGDLTNSRIFRVHPLLSAMVFPYGQDYHLTHHLFAMLPHYHMKQAHQILLRYAPYREQVVICRGFFFRPRGSSDPTVLDELSRTPKPGDLIWDGPPRSPLPAALKAAS